MGNISSANEHMHGKAVCTRKHGRGASKTHRKKRHHSKRRHTHKRHSRRQKGGTLVITRPS
jgi:hypothetical protein